MTLLMKIEVATYFILKALGYIAGIVGGFAIFGLAGELEWDSITIAQFCLYEFCAFCLVGFSIVSYIAREIILEDCRMRYRRMRRQTTKTN